MRKVLSLVVVFILALAACGCQNTKSKAPEGTLIGGVLGAASGAEQTAVQAEGGTQMSILQVVELSKQGAPDDVIIDKIKKSNSKFSLTGEDIDYLKKQGISQKVIDAM